MKLQFCSAIGLYRTIIPSATLRHGKGPRQSITFERPQSGNRENQSVVVSKLNSIDQTRGIISHLPGLLHSSSVYTFSSDYTYICSVVRDTNGFGLAGHTGSRRWPDIINKLNVIDCFCGSISEPNPSVPPSGHCLAAVWWHVCSHCWMASHKSSAGWCLESSSLALV